MRVAPHIWIDESEFEERFVRASGPGGQNVNKVATAVQLRFDVLRSKSLAPDVQSRLLKLAGSRATRDGAVIIVADRFRTQLRNRADARERLLELLRKAAQPPRPRKPTKVPVAARRRRLEDKRRRSTLKRERTSKLSSSD